MALASASPLLPYHTPLTYPQHTARLIISPLTFSSSPASSSKASIPLRALLLPSATASPPAHPCSARQPAHASSPRPRRGALALTPAGVHLLSVAHTRGIGKAHGVRSPLPQSIARTSSVVVAPALASLPPTPVPTFPSPPAAPDTRFAASSTNAADACPHAQGSPPSQAWSYPSATVLGVLPDCQARKCCLSAKAGRRRCRRCRRCRRFSLPAAGTACRSVRSCRSRTLATLRLTCK